MTPYIYPLSSSTVPKGGVIDVPCYEAQSFNGKTALLHATGALIPFDFATLTERDFDLVTGERGDEWTIQGVIAVDADWLVGVMEVTTSAPVPKTLGAEIDEVWYYITPMNTVPTVVAGQYVVLGLYR
ncbi:hypothetical protein GCM10008955_10860 [Deinococcus malanensis]|uniref:Uncharacterized protein n=1 Tax=Deinococcus malanensis TaxID=1706855 RepID=A0ABQ2ET22_9DEIO|nr:hypothetical protein [Deinococcus malanensis]GGK19248.1 hypothetical protein GCM10008955_10860 [Deinococcus malanensis]